MTRLAIILSTALAGVAAGPAMADLDFRYDGRFTQQEQARLETWTSEVKAAVESLVGPYPIDIVVRFQRVQSPEPVPFAKTMRGREQGIRFLVNPEFSLAEFRDDWTAAHEFSHLLLPFVGRNDAWFSEGFASYMQYQVMHEMAVIGPGEATRRYRERLDRARRHFGDPAERFIDSTPRLRAERNYPVMYWGGSVFFFRLASSLEDTANITLVDLLAEYLRCCRSNRSSVDALVAEFDRIVGSGAAQSELTAFRSIRGFPDYADLHIGIGGVEPAEAE